MASIPKNPKGTRAVSAGTLRLADVFMYISSDRIKEYVQSKAEGGFALL